MGGPLIHPMRLYSSTREASTTKGRGWLSADADSDAHLARVSMNELWLIEQK